LGEPEDVDAVTEALENYRTAAEEAFEAGEIGTHELSRRVGLSGSVLSLMEDALNTVAGRFQEGQEAVVKWQRAVTDAERNQGRNFDRGGARRFFLEEETEAWYNNAAAIEENQLR